MAATASTLPGPSRPGLRWPLSTSAVTASLCLVVALFARWGPDWPAQEFRAAFAREAGLVAWNDQWYGGHPLPGYSVLYPPLGAAIGAAATGVLAAVVAAWMATRLLGPVRGRAHAAAVGTAVAVSLAFSLFLGQIPFLVGVAFGLGALSALRAHHGGAAAVLAAASSLASPLVAGFLLLGALAFAFTAGPRRATPLLGAGAGLLVAVLVGGASGPMPSPWVVPLEVSVFCAQCWWFAPADAPVFRRFALLYALAALGASIVPNPVGGNVARLGALIALPLTVRYVRPGRGRRAVRFLAALAPALAWPLVPVVSAISNGAADPSRNAAYYAGLDRFLASQDPRAGRLEIPFTREHWEAAQVAPHFPIARGWERQTDLAYDEVLYRPLTAAAYRTWLRGAAVALVALPDAPLDSGGRPEAAVIRTRPPYLREVWHDAHWQVYRFTDAVGLASGPGQLHDLAAASFRVTFSAPGDETVRIRDDKLWRVTSGSACLFDGGDGWLHVRARAAGTVTVRARYNLQLLTRSRTDCDPIAR